MMRSNNWIKMVSLVLALCMVLSVNLNVLAVTQEDEVPGVSTPVTPQEPAASDSPQPTVDPLAPTQPTTAPTQPQIPDTSVPEIPAPSEPDVTMPSIPEDTQPSIPEDSQPSIPDGPGTSVPDMPEPSQPETTAPTAPPATGDQDPVLKHTPITSIKHGEDVVFQVSVTDDYGIQDVILYYRAINASYWDMKIFEASSGDTFVCILASDEIFDAGMEYYIEASDGSNLVSSGSKHNPHTFYYDHNFSIIGVSPSRIDINTVTYGFRAVLMGSNFVAGMILSVDGINVPYTLSSSNMLVFYTPQHDIGTADVVLEYNNNRIQLDKAITFYDSSSALSLRQDTEVENGTQIRIPLWASAHGNIFSIQSALELDPGIFSNIHFVLDENNNYAEATYFTGYDGLTNVIINSEAALNTAFPIGYLIADINAPSGSTAATIQFRTAYMNHIEVSQQDPCTFTVIDKNQPVITILPFDTTPTRGPVTVYATVLGGSLEKESHTFYSNGQYTFTATDASGNIVTETVTVSHIYQNYTLSLLNVPEKLLVIEGAVLDVSGWLIQINYDCGVTPATVHVSAEMVQIPSYVVGRTEGFVVYEGLSVPFSCEVISNELAQLQISKPPVKLQYLPGEPLDLTGLEIIFSCGENYILTLTAEQYTVVGFDPDRNGTQEITVSYGDYSTSFTVRVKSTTPTEITSSVYKIENGLISGISVGDTMDILLEGIEEAEFIRIMDNGIEIAIDDLLCTGMVIELFDDENVIASLTIVVSGDVSGDGGITISDMIAIKSQLLGNKVLEGAAFLAADYNGDGNITISDFVRIKSYILNDGEI